VLTVVTYSSELEQ